MVLIKIPRKYQKRRKRNDIGDLGNEKYSKEYYQDLWKYGYKNGEIKPMENNYTYHKHIANEFDRNFGYSYYDKYKRRMVYNRSKSSRRYYKNFWNYKYKDLR